MLAFRSSFAVLAVALLAVLASGCGSDDPGSDDRDARDASPATTDDVAEPDSPEGERARSGGASIALTPALRACMSTAGFSQDPKPVTGGIASWRSDSGAQVVVTPSSEVALTVAGEIGTTEAPARVEGVRVSAGPPALVSAAAACLDA